MTQNSDLKARVRARMAQTGEPYTKAKRALAIERIERLLSSWDGPKTSTFYRLDSERVRLIQESGK